MADLDSLLKLMTGKNVSLYPFQRRMVAAIAAGRNVVTVAPTGSGKTWGAILPFVKAAIDGTPIADRLIYALPLRTLASGLHRKTLDEINRLGCSLSVSIQTGEDQADSFFESDICFTTIDQLLSSYLNIPVSLPDKLSNINAGAFIGALVVFDEVHLLDPARARRTLLEMVGRLRKCTQFVLMTATLGADSAALLAQHLDAELVIVPASEIMEMPSHRSKERRFVWVGQPLTAEMVAQSHRRLINEGKPGRTLVICNSVRHAQTIYSDLKKLPLDKACVFLLHSRFTAPDRRKKEKVIEPYFGPEAILGDAILVTTQVIEAGMDMSADELHTELCPANSLIQRAGRCARYPEPRNIGTVYVYDLELTAGGQRRLGPYRDGSQPFEIAQTRQNLSMLPEAGAVWTVENENTLIEAVHGLTELSLTRSSLHRSSLGATEDGVADVLQYGLRSAILEFIRDIDSVTVFVSDNPEELNVLERPFLVSVPRVSLAVLDGSADVLGRVPTYEDDLDESEGRAILRWHSVGSIASSWLMALSTEVANYDPDLGLILGVSGKNQVIQYRGRERWEPYSYTIETYSDHVRRVLARSVDFQNRTAVASVRLATLYGLATEQIEWLIRISCSLHDAGKLSADWQAKARRWQRERHPEDAVPKGEMLAHTTKNGDADMEYSRKPRYRFPPHSVEGAAIVFDSIARSLSETCCEGLSLARVIATCIARHHSSRAAKYALPLNLAEGGVDQINTTLALIGSQLTVSEIESFASDGDREEFAERVILSAKSDRQLLPLYWYLVRITRLSDQRSLADMRR